MRNLQPKLLCTFFLITTMLNAQQKKVLADSVLVKKIDSFSAVFVKHLSLDLDAAEAEAQKMLDFSNKHNYLKGIGISYGNFGGVNSYMGKQGNAIAYFVKSAEIFDRIDNKRNAAITNMNIGNLFVDQEQFDEAKRYYVKAHEYALTEDKENLPTTYMGLALIALETNKSLEEIRTTLKKAEAVAIEIKDTLVLSNILRLQGKAQIERNVDLPYAISRINRAIKLNNMNSPNNHFALGNSYLYIGKAHWKMGNHKKALSYNDSSLVHYKALDYFKGLRLTYNNRKEILASLGNYKEAFETYRLYSKHNDSTFQKQRANQVARMKIEYETDQAIAQKETAEATAALAREKSNRNRNFLIAAIVISALILVSSLLYLSSIKTKKKSEIIALELKETQKRLALEKQYRDSELKALKAQMNPHFIFNALNSIQEYIILNKKNLAGDYLGRFADLMRKYLKHSDAGTLTIQDEIESLEMYLDLESLRFEDTFTYIFNVSDKINTEQLSIPTMLIQPYVENALKHGLLHKKTDRKLWINFEKGEEKTILCTIEDNGIGRIKSKEIKEQNKNLHVSFATKATENRLYLLNYKKSQKIGVETSDLLEEDGSVKGTRVVLNIPTVLK